MGSVSAARQAPPRASLADSGSVRLVQRHHCLYRVEAKGRRVQVLVLPKTPAAAAWMRRRELDQLRVICSPKEVTTWIERQERAIEERI